jgi:RNA polymerase sigma-70 factor (ECF subfamily)
LNTLTIQFDLSGSLSSTLWEWRTLLCALKSPTPTCVLALTDDASDIRAALEGNSDSYARLVRRYQESIGAMMWRFTRNPREWEELVHDVFVEAYFSLASFRARAPFEHWLKRIATRTGYRYWKRQQRHRQEEPLTEEPSASCEQALENASDAAELVQQLLGQLAPRDRLVMTLTYLEGKTVAEIAALTGWSKTLVKVQAHRARGRLTKICQARGIEL